MWIIYYKFATNIFTYLDIHFEFTLDDYLFILVGITYKNICGMQTKYQEAMLTRVK